MTADSTMASLQERAFSEPADYDSGSPHLIHQDLRQQIIETVRESVLERLGVLGHCRVLDVGAGQGMFADHALAAGANVLLTEMSLPSVEWLTSRLRHNSAASVAYDPDGEEVFRRDDGFDAVMCVSVLHHIPDYALFLSRIVDRIQPGGTFISFQDPLFYPRRRRSSLRFERFSFMAWRIWQGNLGRGLATQLRRWRGIYDEGKPGDMVEYHVVRQGVDEERVSGLLRSHFPEVSVIRYWSTQSRILQRLGTRLGLTNTFAVVARHRA